MARKWTDERDNTIWHVSAEGAAAQVGGPMYQLIVFRGREAISTVYEGSKEPSEFSDQELSALLDRARQAIRE